MFSAFVAGRLFEFDLGSVYVNRFDREKCTFNEYGF